MPPPVRRSIPIGFGSSAVREISGFPSPNSRRRRNNSNSPSRSPSRVGTGVNQHYYDAAAGGPVQLSPLSSPGGATTIAGQSPIPATTTSGGQNRRNSQQQHHQNPNDSAPCVLEDLMALDPDHSQQQQEQHKQQRPSINSGHPRNLPRPTSATQQQQRKSSTATTANPRGAQRPSSANSLPPMASDDFSNPTSARRSSNSGNSTARGNNNLQTSNSGAFLSSRNLAAASAAATAVHGDQAIGKQLRRIGAKVNTGAAALRSSGSGGLFSPSGTGGGGGRRASPFSGGGGALGAMLNDEGGVAEQEALVYPLVAALHTARDQLHLPSRVVEWMREVLSWNVSSNAHEANSKICHLVDTIRLVTLELFRMVDEIELLHEKAMNAWRTIPAGSDSTGTARAHATFTDAHGRLKQIATVFFRLAQKWQQGHAQLFDTVRPAAVPPQLPAAFIFTCAASNNDDYVLQLQETMSLLETTAASFSSMIFQGASTTKSADESSAQDFMSVPAMAQSQRRGSRRGSTAVPSLESSQQMTAAAAADVSNASAAQSAQDFSIVRRPVSASAARRAAALAAAAAAADINQSQHGDDATAVTDGVTHSRRMMNSSGAVSLGEQQQMLSYSAFATTKQSNDQQPNDYDRQQQELNASSLASQASASFANIRAAFEARRVRSAQTLQRWWRRVFRKMRHGESKSMTDALFDEAMSYLSTTNQQRWTKRDTMLLHDIARRLHFLRCMRRIERFCSNVWIPKHFAVLKIQAAVRSFFWRKRDKQHRRRRKAALAIQRWFHDCLRRRERRKYLREKRAAAIKARALRAARSAATSIRAAPPPEEDLSLVERVAPQLVTGFAVLGPGNLCMALFEKNGGVEGNRWSDEEPAADPVSEVEAEQKRRLELAAARRAAGENDDDDDDDNHDNDGQRRKRPAAGRPRSAAERMLIRPGKRVSSFTAKMLRFCDNENVKNSNHNSSVNNKNNNTASSSQQASRSNSQEPVPSLKKSSSMELRKAP